MVKINFKIGITLICIIFLGSLNNSIALCDGYVHGKIVYSDNREAVTSGLVKIFNLDKNGKAKALIETVDIQPNGEFKFTNPPENQTDGIKIMAYPNDVDNQENPFEPVIIDYNKALASSDKTYQMILSVDRNPNYAHSPSKKEKEYTLKQNFPNPFNPSTLISFELPNQTNVTLKVYNMNGETVAILAENEKLDAGLNEFTFNAAGLPSGIYVYSLIAGGFSENKKMILLK